MNDRTRGRGQRKGDGAVFNFKDKFAADTGAFGYKWLQKNKLKNPSLKQIVDGLKNHWMNNVVLATARGMPKDKAKKITKQYETAFTEILKRSGEKKAS